MTHVDDHGPVPSAECLRCREIVDLVTDYLEDTLSPVEHERFEAHLVDCSGCQIYLAQMRQTRRMLEQLATDPIATEAHQELLDLFRDWKAGRVR